jgi:hypothetical protein
VEQSKDDGVTEGTENRHPHQLQKGTTNTYSVKECNFLKHRLIVFHQIIYFFLIYPKLMKACHIHMSCHFCYRFMMLCGCVDLLGLCESVSVILKEAWTFH